VPDGVVPGGQREHDAAPSGWIQPVGHLTGFSAGLPHEKPVGHWSHSPAPVRLAYRPLGHTMQFCWPNGEYVPAGHVAGGSVTRRQDEPTGHCRHMPDWSRVYVPLGHRPVVRQDTPVRETVGNVRSTVRTRTSK
jgi:hypothetical protein